MRFAKLVLAITLCAATAGLAVAQLQTQYNLTDLYLESTYLPPVTPYPWAPAWSPDGSCLAFATQGSIWTVPASGGEAKQLTFSREGYDSQPCWDAEGQRIAFTRDTGKSIDIWCFDRNQGEERRLTSHNAVSVSPKWHPTKPLLLYSSNAACQAFCIRQLSLETGESAVVYEASPSSALSPAWSPDGNSIVFQSNKPLDSIKGYGAGYLYTLRLDPQFKHEPRLLLKEELFHVAQPQWNPLGDTILYVGQDRGRTNLRLAHPVHGNPVTLAQAGSDGYSPAWSPDGKRIAFIAPHNGEMTLCILDLLGGAPEWVAVARKRYKVPFGRLNLTVLDPMNRRPTPARIYVRASDGKAYFPLRSIHRQSQATGDHYSYCRGVESIDLPAGQAEIEAVRGFDRVPQKVRVVVPDGGIATAEITLAPLLGLAARGWYNGDTHCHLTYGGTLPLPSERFGTEASGEDVDVANILIANRDNTLLGVESFSPLASGQKANGAPLLVFGQEFRPTFSGHLGLLAVDQLISPPYIGFRGTPHDSDYPSNSRMVDMARSRGGLAGYSHPYYLSDKDPEEYDYQGAREFPADVALGKVDYLDVLCVWSYENSTSRVWHRLLNLGFRIPAAAGTDCFLDFWRTPPVGSTRVYVKSDSLDRRAWLDGLAKGKSFVTNGPLVLLEVDGKPPGEVLSLPPDSAVPVKITAASILSITKIELLYNSKVVWSVQPSRDRRVTEGNLTLKLPYDGWIAARVTGPDNQHIAMDTSTFAHTNPIYVTVGKKNPEMNADARYFLKWCNRCIELIHSQALFHSDDQRREVLDTWERARLVFERLSIP